jgi:hypothetical protein
MFTLLGGPQREGLWYDAQNAEPVNSSAFTIAA